MVIGVIEIERENNEILYDKLEKALESFEDRT